ncbi:MAG: hydroxyisourate hydrolase [Vicinamibacteria bacterium]|nr:hydroxyisourate hydrolase [Vicinamibacteria bacterium]
MKSPITTHVLDTSIGKPAANVAARLERISEAETVVLGSSVTNADGRIGDLVDGPLDRGRYRITFDTAAYFAERGVSCFFPEISILFEITDTTKHHHVPLLLSPFGYSTYRGS